MPIIPQVITINRVATKSLPVLAALFLAAGPVLAAPPALFEANGPELSATETQGLKGILRANYSANSPWFSPGVLFQGETVDLTLFADARFGGVLELVERGGADNAHLTGTLQGLPGSRFELLLVEGLILGEVRPGDGTVYLLQPGQQGLTRILHIHEDDQPLCGADDLIENSGPRPDVTTGGGEDGELGPVDVLVVYTPRVELVWGGPNQVRAQVRQWIINTNRYFQLSDVRTRLRLVHVALTNYVESGSSGQDLDRLRGTSDGHMDEVHALRNAVGADMVALIADVSDVCGIAYLYTGSPTRAFSLTDVHCGSLTLAHELGHNFGCCHNPAAAGSGSGCFDNRSFGYVYNGDSGTLWRTIMAYPPGQRIEYFSNPNLIHDGQPFGSGTAFNAATIDATAPSIAGFRNTVPAPDCNGNYISDAIDILSGASADDDGNGIPSECEPALSGWLNRTGDLAASPSARQHHAMVFDASRNVTVLVHGLVGSTRNRETWEFNGTTWTQRSNTGPTARREHALAYDGSRQRTVLFGGNTTAGRNAETWEWNGTTWTQRMISGPSARQNHAMAYDSTRGVVVLFGGNVASGLSAETWEFDGTSWTLRNPMTSPSAREGHAMAYDPIRQRTLLFGGVDANGESNQLWTWDGNEWARLRVVTPTSRSEHAMIFDSSRNVVVLFGGSDGSEFPGQTWTWNGTAWSLQTAAGPAGRQNHGMAYDSARGAVVLFGGAGSGGTTNQQTWELLNRAPTISVQPLDQFRCTGTSVSFSVEAISFMGAPLSYQWRRNGNMIPGATASVLTINPVTEGSQASYSCVVANTFGATVSESAYLQVGSGPTIIIQPPAQVITLNGEGVTIEAFADGSNPLHLRWQRNGADVADGPRTTGSESLTLSINPVQRSDAGFYRLVVTDACGQVSSTSTRLRVVDPGDLNCDGQINFDDIGPFVIALISDAGYTAQFPDCERLNADTNRDGLVNFADIDSFVALLVSGG